MRALILFFALSVTVAHGQHRILFLLDGSGSMTADWGGQAKWSTATALLTDLADSLARTHDDLELGLRVFGNSSPRADEDCTDSHLEIDFGPFSATTWRRTLADLTPQGQTPIAYSLQQAGLDFPDLAAANRIILITDGLETCDGDPCAVAEALRDRRVTVDPHIIGLDIADSLHGRFACIGTFVNARDAGQLSDLLIAAADRLLAPTTWALKLFDPTGAPMAQVPFALFDHASGDLVDAWILHLPAHIPADTLSIDPRGRYDLVLYAWPAIRRTALTFPAGRHTDVGVQMPTGHLVHDPRHRTIERRRSGAAEHHVGHTPAQLTVTGLYERIAASRPPRIRTVTLDRAATDDWRLAPAGTLTLDISTPGVLQILVDDRSVLHRTVPAGPLSLDWQPDTYTIVFRPSDADHMDRTTVRDAVVRPSETTTIVLP